MLNFTRLLSLICLFVGAGCVLKGDGPEPTVPNLTQQAARVRAGEADELRVDQEFVSDADLALLEGLVPRLKSINFSRTNISDTGLALVCQCEQLERLRLQSDQITDAGLAPLASLKQLQHLHLIGAPLTDAGLKQLHELKSLESLYLDGVLASDEAKAQLGQALPEVHMHINGEHP